MNSAATTRAASMLAEARHTLQRVARQPATPAAEGALRAVLDRAAGEHVAPEDFALAAELTRLLAVCTCPAPGCRPLAKMTAIAMELPRPDGPTFMRAVVVRLVEMIPREAIDAERIGTGLCAGALPHLTLSTKDGSR